MSRIEAAERELAAQEEVGDRDLPPEDISDAGLALLLYRRRGKWPSRSEVEALRAAVARERGRRRAERAAEKRRELRAEAAAERRRRARPRLRTRGDVILLDLLTSAEGQLAIRLAWETAELLAACAAQLARRDAALASAPALPRLPRDTRGRREAAELVRDYCEAKLRPGRPGEAEVMQAARHALPWSALAWCNAAHPVQLHELADELYTLRWSGRPLHKRLARLLADGAVCVEEWPQVAQPEAGPPRGWLPLPMPDDGVAPAAAPGTGAGPAPGRR